MKTMLIFAAYLIFISGATSAREVMVGSTVAAHAASPLAERHAGQFESSEGGVSCTTKYITIARVDGSSAIRKSVNCEE